MFRLHLIFGSLTCALLWFSLHPPQEEFSFASIQLLAEASAAGRYREQASPLPGILAGMNYDQTRDIRWLDRLSVWQARVIPFQLRFFHRTGTQPDRIDVYLLKQGTAEKASYSPRQFNFGKNAITEPLSGDLGYAGFRIHYPINSREKLDEVIVFLQASYFRAVGKGQQYGLSARGLALNTHLSKQKEEFPRFTRFWVREPAWNAASIQIYALLEGPSVAGAYEFWVTPGEETRVDVRAALYFRKKVERLGLAPLTSMYWFGENYRADVQDFRPEVHDSDGLLVNTGKGEWIWRPLSNARHARENLFFDENPKGFGLLQRDRNFENYQDLESRYHLRPSVWVVPGQAWGRGSVELVQIPTNNEVKDNVIAFWKPEQAPALRQPLEVSYTLFWYLENERHAPLAGCVQTRIHYPVSREPAQFVLDFEGDALDRFAPDHPPVLEVSADPPEALGPTMLQKNEYAKNWRATLSLLPQAGKKPVEIRCRLMEGDRPLTETWTYTWEE